MANQLYPITVRKVNNEVYQYDYFLTSAPQSIIALELKFAATASRVTTIATVFLRDHGFKAGDSVVLVGVDEFDGTKTITSVTQDTFNYDCVDQDATTANINVKRVVVSVNQYEGTTAYTITETIAQLLEAVPSGYCIQVTIVQEGNAPYSLPSTSQVALVFTNKIVSIKQIKGTLLVTSAARTLTTVTVTIASGHGLQVGQYFTINSLTAALDGTYAVATVTSPTVFTYETTSSGDVAAEAGTLYSENTQIVLYTEGAVTKSFIVNETYSIILGEQESGNTFENAIFINPNRYSTGTGIIAGTTQTQAGATLLTKEWNNVITVGTTNDGVKLPPALFGYSITVKNTGANVAKVYPNTGDFIDDESVNVAILIGVEQEITFRAIDSATWESNIETITQAIVNATTLNVTGVSTFGAPNVYSNATGLTAVGSSISDALALTAEWNNVTSSASSAVGVKLMVAVAGKNQIVFNNSANSIHCYPVASSYIDGVQNTGVILQVGEMAIFHAIDATHWVTNRVFVNVTTVALPDGLVSALPLRFGADGNNGLYGVSDTQLGVAVEGALVSIFDADGIKVLGIGEQIADVGVQVLNNLVSTKGLQLSKTAVPYNAVYVALKSDYHIFFTTATGASGVDIGTFAFPVNTILVISDFDCIASTSNITVDAGAGKVIISTVAGGAQTFVMNTDGQSITLHKLSATQWKVI